MHEIMSTNVNIIVLCKNKVEVDDVVGLLSGGLSAETASLFSLQRSFHRS